MHHRNLQIKASSNSNSKLNFFFSCNAFRSCYGMMISCIIWYDCYWFCYLAIIIFWFRKLSVNFRHFHVFLLEHRAYWKTWKSRKILFCCFFKASTLFQQTFFKLSTMLFRTVFLAFIVFRGSSKYYSKI